MLVFEMAWQHFVDSFLENKKHTYKASIKLDPELVESFYKKILNVLKKMEIEVCTDEDLEIGEDAFGDPFVAAGWWYPEESKIKISKKNPLALTHEFIHAIDFRFYGIRTKADQELIASAVTYILLYKYFATHSPQYATSYAKRQGATTEDLERLKSDTHLIYQYACVLLI